MELSLEAYRNIVKYVGNRADIATLCRVSKSFRHVAQRALYNTLYLRDVHSTISLCGLLAREPRLATLVDALTISFSGAQEGGSDDDSSESGSDEEEASSQPPSASEYWAAVAPALRQTVRLRFHCDLDWDTHLVSFLNTQPDLDDLYILDYKDPNHAPQHTVSSTDSPIRLLPSALPKLSTLECTFSEAAVALVPGRPVTHLKSCFSRTRLEEKQAEVSLLFSKIKLSTRRLKALDIADASYTETFSMTLLQHVIRTRATVTELRYLGTLVLPIGGQEVCPPSLSARPASSIAVLRAADAAAARAVRGSGSHALGAPAGRADSLPRADPRAPAVLSHRHTRRLRIRVRPHRDLGRRRPVCAGPRYQHGYLWSEI
ncbi:MAPKK kinase [Salix suchowensis]|nr:MAPKK kinase [Salix suchowensis]